MKIVDVFNYEGLYSISDSGMIINKRTGNEIHSCPDGHGYRIVGLYKNGKRKTEKIHQLVYRSFNGMEESGLQIDHIDNNKANNNLSNLRAITQRENVARAKNSEIRGVNKYRNKWGANIQIGGERFFLGLYDTKEDAGVAYQTALADWERKGIKPFKRPQGKKFCKGCGEWKDESEFYYVKNHGYSYLCKECHKEEMKRRNLKYKLNNIGNGKVFK